MEKFSMMIDNKKNEVTLKIPKKRIIKEAIDRLCNRIKENALKLQYFYDIKFIDLKKPKENDDIETTPSSVEMAEDEKEIHLYEKSSQIICPKCKKIAIIYFKDYKLSIRDCENGHKTNLSLEDFIESQMIEKTQIKCNVCQKNKDDNGNGKYFICSCGQFLCSKCRNEHENDDHSTIEFDKRDYYCLKHCSELISYCKDCKKNLCYLCEDEHKNHKKIRLTEIKPENEYINELKKTISELKIKIDSFSCQIKPNELIEKIKIKFNEEINFSVKNLNNEVNNMVNRFKTEVSNLIHKFEDRLNLLLCNMVKIEQLKKDLLVFYNINNNMLDNYNKRFKNYQILKNINEIKENINPNCKVPKEITKILEENSINNKITLMIDMYNEITEQEITILYDITKTNSNKVRIFGSNFTNNNKENCKIIVNGKEKGLCDYYEYSKNEIDNNVLKIKLVKKKPIKDMSYMFSHCSSLISLPDISQWNTINSTNMSNMFDDCSSLVTLPDISKWNIMNVTNISYMFSHCSSLLSLPDLSKWNTKNVTNMSYMFYDCQSLISLPDISKWTTAKVTNMSYMFYDCQSLISLPDISLWNIGNVTNMGNMFYDCSSLLSLPDISKWNTKNVNNMSYLFYDCQSFTSIPDISQWNTKNVNNMSYMFYDCSSLTSIPDISQWNTKPGTNTYCMFYNCSSLTPGAVPNEIK